MLHVPSCRLALLALALPLGRALGQDNVVYHQVPLYNGAMARLDTLGPVAALAAAPAVLFPRLRAVYRQLSIPADLDDSTHLQLGTLRVVKTRNMAGVWMSRIVDCGAGYSGSLANTADVEFSIVSFLRPVGRDSASLRTAVVAVAHPVEGTQGLTPCNSLGYLEEQVRRRLEAAARH